MKKLILLGLLLTGCADFHPIDNIPFQKKIVMDIIYYDPHDYPFSNPCSNVDGNHSESNGGCAYRVKDSEIGELNEKGEIHAEPLETWVMICPKPYVVGQQELIGICGHETLHAVLGYNWHLGLDYHENHSDRANANRNLQNWAAEVSGNH